MEHAQLGAFRTVRTSGGGLSRFLWAWHVVVSPPCWNFYAAIPAQGCLPLQA